MDPSIFIPILYYLKSYWIFEISKTKERIKLIIISFIFYIFSKEFIWNK